ncbi:MAG TPA: hypothetical protein VFT60_08435 [Bryobacteraceae bacterium]|jgi:hypothetical protein|nr:hypothetical protein [Bryobacteraceae bacterium]
MASPLCRIVAVCLLLSGAADFLQFDSSDPSASMSASGPAAQHGQPAPDGHRYSPPARVHAPALPDDGCIFCGTALLIAPVVTAFEPPVSEFRMDSTLAEYELLSDLRHPPPRPSLS